MYYFIVNPNAQKGFGEKLWRKLERCLNKNGIEYEVYLTKGRGDARAYAQKISEACSEPGVITAVGGDGTLNEVVDGLEFVSPLVLGYIPAGAGRNLARGLRITGNWRKNLKKIIASEKYRKVDYGILSYEKEGPVHRRFLVSCGIGLDAEICHVILAEARTERNERKKICSLRFGRLKYVFYSFVQLLQATSVKGYLILDGVKKVEFNRIFSISAHIQPYEGGGFCVAPQADAEDGLLEVCVLHSCSRLSMLQLLFDSWIGKKKNHKGVRYYSCRDLKVHTEVPVPVHVDGESCYCQTDIEISCIRKKIKIVV